MVKLSGRFIDHSCQLDKCFGSIYQPTAANGLKVRSQSRLQEFRLCKQVNIEGVVSL